MEEIKQCECGCKKIEAMVYIDSPSKVWMICTCCGRSGDKAYNRRDAIKLWNINAKLSKKI